MKTTIFNINLLYWYLVFVNTMSLYKNTPTKNSGNKLVKCTLIIAYISILLGVDSNIRNILKAIEQKKIIINEFLNFVKYESNGISR